MCVSSSVHLMAVSFRQKNNSYSHYFFPQMSTSFCTNDGVVSRPQSDPHQSRTVIALPSIILRSEGGWKRPPWHFATSQENINQRKKKV